MYLSLPPNSIETMITKSDIKSKILISPQQLLNNSAILVSLHLSKTGNGTAYDTKDLDSREINRSLSSLPNTFKEVLAGFDEAHSAARESAINVKYKKGRAGIAYREFYPIALLRELHDLFERLKPFAPLVNWYHKIWIDKTKAKTGPCSFSAYKPQLQFDIDRQSGGLDLKTTVLLNGAAFDISGFERFHFLLLSGSEYFLLGFKEYKTLEWLRDVEPQQYSMDPEAMAQQVLAKLETDYKVNRNGHFLQNVIEADPVKRVLLTEISGSFLVLTPQWLYEGFLVEGPWKETYEITRAGEAYTILRNRDQEQEFTQLLETLHPNFLKQRNGYYYLSFADAQKKQWFLKSYHFLLQQDIQVTGMDMLQHFRYSQHKAATEISIKEQENNLLTVTISLKFGTEEVSLTELQKILLAGQKAILLKDGSLGILDDDWTSRYGVLIKHGKVLKKEITVAKGMALAGDSISSEAPVLNPVIKKEWWQKWRQWQQTDDILFAIPPEVTATLRPYQHKGYEWMTLLAEAGAGACLADDMGLGKTLQTICFLAYRFQQDSTSKFLVICPSSLVYNWMQEFQKFAPHLQTKVHHGPHRDINAMADDGHQAIITTYSTLRADIDKISATRFDVVVIDESHNIKNPAALITRAVNQLTANTRIALSGTPVMNNTFDLYAQLSFLLPGMFGSREFFKREYADAIDRDRDADKIKVLQKLTAPFILRRTKEQVASDLPEKIETVLWCTMKPDQKLVYESIRENVRSSIFLDIKENGLNSGKLGIIIGMLKLRQACNSPELVKDETHLTGESIKTEVLVEELKNIIPLHKALVFSQFTGMLDLLEVSLQKQGIVFCRLDGNTPIVKRQELVDQFQQADGPERVFLISLKAGNAGLNLTAADYVFLFDPWWNTAVQQQAIDRTHRIGQTKNVFAYKMICKDTIEEKIIQLQQRKKKLADELIGGEEGFVKALSEDDIDFLFG